MSDPSLTDRPAPSPAWPATDQPHAVHDALDMTRARRAACEVALADLQSGGPAARIKAIADLVRNRQPWAVEGLCRALKDEDQAVRVAAAEALGELGDGRAIQPLIEALRSCFSGGSGRKHRAIGLASLAFSVLLVACVAFGAAVGNKAFLLGPLVQVIWFVAGYFKRRRARSVLCGTITGAFTRIAERHPTPEFRKVLPDLEAIAADSLQQEDHTREASRVAAERIKTLTEKLMSLPVPASTPAPDTAALPLPAGAPTADAETLPRVGR